MIAVCVDVSKNKSTVAVIYEHIDLLKQTELLSNAIMHQMHSIACIFPEYGTVLSIDGVGFKLAPILIAEIGDAHRLTNAHVLNAFAGKDAPPL